MYLCMSVRLYMCMSAFLYVCIHGDCTGTIGSLWVIFLHDASGLQGQRSRVRVRVGDGLRRANGFL